MVEGIGGKKNMNINKNKPTVIEKGWECPRCRRVNAPWMSSCNCRSTREEEPQKWNGSKLVVCPRCGGMMENYPHYC